MSLISYLQIYICSICRIRFRVLMTITITLLCCGQANSSESFFEEAVYRLFFKQVYYGDVPVLVNDTAFLIRFDAIVNVLGYRSECDAKLNRFSFFYTADSCMQAHRDSLAYNGYLYITGKKEAMFYEGGYYLSPELIDRMSPFALELANNSLSINLSSFLTPPVVTKQRVMKSKAMIEKERSRMDFPTDTFHYKMFKLTGLGYTLSNTNSKRNKSEWYTRMGLYGELLKGFYTLNYLYQPSNIFRKNDVTFRWTNPVISTRWLKKITAYRDYNQLTFTTKGYSNGFEISNYSERDILSSPYRYQGVFVPNAEIELYNNNKYISTMMADEYGRISGDCLLFPGNNQLASVYYDAYYQPVRSVASVYMPHDFTPRGTFLYTAGGGYVDDGSWYGKARFSYGITRGLMLSLKLEYLWKDGNVKQINMWGIKYAPSEGFCGEIQYAPAMSLRVAMSGALFNFFNYSFLAERYNRKQTVVKYNPLDKATVFLNFRTPIFNCPGNLFLSVQYYKYPYSTNFNTNTQWNLYWRSITGSIFASTTSDRGVKLINMTYGARLGYVLNNRSNVEVNYEYNNRFRESQIRGRYRYQISNLLYANLNADYNVAGRNYSVNLGVSYYLPWIQLQNNFNFSAQSWSNTTTVSGSALFFGPRNVEFTNRYAAGASLHIRPFLDVNGDGCYQKEEPILKDVVVNVRAGGQTQRNAQGIFINGISSYFAFQVVIPNQPLKDISWQIDHKTHTFMLLPFENRTVEVPVKVISEIYGRVMIKNKKGDLTGKANAIVNFYSLRDKKTFSLVTDDAGYYSYVGLTAGNYVLKVSDSYLKKMKLSVDGTPLLQIEIKPDIEGMQIEGLDFVLQ